MILKQLNEIESPTDRLKFILENKVEIKKAKRHDIKPKSQRMPTLGQYLYEPVDVNKAVPSPEGTFRVVANSTGFIDSHDDVSMRGSFNKTVKENGRFIQILNSHKSDTVTDIIAANRGVFTADLPIRTLGYDAAGDTEVLMADIEVISPSIAKRYEKGAITQHSIALQYVKLELAVNDPSYEEEYKVWERTFNQVINKEKALENGFYWAIFEQKVFEISAVVFGSNQYTPPTDYTDNQENNKSLETKEPSQGDTQKEVAEPTKEVDFETKFLKKLQDGRTKNMAERKGY